MEDLPFANGMVTRGCNLSVFEWIRALHRRLQPHSFHLAVTVMWSIWFARNNRVFKGKKGMLMGWLSLMSKHSVIVRSATPD
ncbi:conserved hypothetical protein [Ricinus communis]|uniref:Uncharacterized protein n=1 Tax=Ricinus communis TaxID=3988 RepID=B9T032_RICCO|nr:conserved hypothetical protein [Ricinus communis]